MKRVGLIAKDMSLKDLKRYRLIFHEKGTPWLEVVKGIGLARYLTDGWPLPDEGIKIFGMQFGGVVTVHLKLVRRDESE